MLAPLSLKTPHTPFSKELMRPSLIDSATSGKSTVTSSAPVDDKIQKRRSREDLGEKKERRERDGREE